MTPTPASARRGLSVVVPVYNEARWLEGVIDEILARRAELPDPLSVIVLNDGSDDWSAALEQRLRRRGPVELWSSYPNAGKGAVLNRAFPLLDTRYAVVIDADGEYPAADIPQLLGPLLRGEADWVLGSRYGFGRPRPRQYRLTYLVNRGINVWFRWLSGIGLHDVLTGLYAFRAELVADLKLRERRFSYTAELMWRLRHGAVRLAEVPVGYRFRSYAEGKKIRWWETGTILLAMLRYKFDRSVP
ncbi:MAG TPA: glycosyltransferase family 2 protein [Candidatus Polarisedimenticolaceae bacterium]|nr:glycosyltransferase family 2 protein [Candidatus Polarisedimenticolaceae bacterium]